MKPHLSFKVHLQIWWYMRLAIWTRYRGISRPNTRIFRRSEAYFTKVLALNPHHLGARLGRGQLRWRELDDFRGAVADLNEVLIRMPNHAEALFLRGMAYIRGGQYHAGIEDFERVLQTASSSRFARYAHYQLPGLYALVEELPGRKSQLQGEQTLHLPDGKNSSTEQ